MVGVIDTSLRLAVIEPHLKRFGGIRRILELTNRLIARGHHVTLFLPEPEATSCDWMECRADVRYLPDAVSPEPFDAVLFNDEPQWFLLDLFPNARRRVHYVLGSGRRYGKEGSWEAVRARVHLRLANSTWTADEVFEETGERPVVLLGGIDRDVFRPVPVTKRYPLLGVGDVRPNKGTSILREAARLSGLPLETYAEKDLDQSEMAAEYSAAEIFLVGSDFEGFGQPGLEALACGVPLVTTDNGGCRDYALDGRTALVVPPRDPDAMAEAIGRLRSDEGLRARLRGEGLALVRDRFDWSISADRLEIMLRELVDTSEPAVLGQGSNLRNAAAEPRLSVVVRADDAIFPLQHCIERVRRHTSSPYELVLVDAATNPLVRAYVAAASDREVLVDRSSDPMHAWRTGLSAARADTVAFLDPAVRVGHGWDAPLVEAAQEGGLSVARTIDGGALAVPGLPEGTVPLYASRRETFVAAGGWRDTAADTLLERWTAGIEPIAVEVPLVVDHLRVDYAPELTRSLWPDALPGSWLDARAAAPAGVDPMRWAQATAYAERRRTAPPPPSQAPSRPRATVVRAMRAAGAVLRTLLPAPARRALFPLVRRVYYRYFPERHPRSHRYGRGSGDT